MNGFEESNEQISVKSSKQIYHICSKFSHKPFFYRVFFVTSVPGKHGASTFGGHLNQVGDLLSRHCNLPEQNKAAGEDGPLSWSVIAQASSIGNLGQNPANWLRSGMLRSLASHKKHKLPLNSNAKFSIIFPSLKNVLNSYKGPDGGGCLPYSKSTHEKQKWLESYLQYVFIYVL